MTSKERQKFLMDKKLAKQRLIKAKKKQNIEED